MHYFFLLTILTCDRFSSHAILGKYDREIIHGRQNCTRDSEYNFLTKGQFLLGVLMV